MLSVSRNCRLDERKRMKELVLERNLLYPDQFELSLSAHVTVLKNKKPTSSVEADITGGSTLNSQAVLRSTVTSKSYVFKTASSLRLDAYSNDDIDNLAINEIFEVEARAAGCTTTAEANRFIEKKRKKEAEENFLRLNHCGQSSVAGKALKSPRELQRNLQPFGSDSLSKATLPIIRSSLENRDVSGLLGADLLSEAEKKMCKEMRILPAHYFKILEILTSKIKKEKIKKNSGVYSFFRAEPSKVD
ncbi:unnamed protein product [Eruca vesicaria subsp. sativa]|uniref:Uncharacterized protein n=1 Tax=Eruca vesicaria subsp. sativa TaxID=29727 RepID=A0ABC8LGD0_ERUVS|nr:unnamed protein product [Eruca vesicaria subsp. sativa]